MLFRSYFITGKRIEKSVYQAEESYMKMFTTVEGQPSPKYLENNSASMGMFVMGLGHSEDNWMEWSNVYSRRGGKYVATIRYASASPSGFTISVNGQDIRSFDGLDTGSSSDNWQTVNVEIPLKKGLNQVRLGNAQGMMPSIDFMELKRGGK